MIILGDCPLTPTGYEVLRASAEGLMHKEIAHQRGIATSTVKNHVSNACYRLEAKNAKHAIAIMFQRGWLT